MNEYEKLLLDIKEKQKSSKELIVGIKETGDETNRAIIGIAQILKSIVDGLSVITELVMNMRENTPVVTNEMKGNPDALTTNEIVDEWLNGGKEE